MIEAKDTVMKQPEINSKMNEWNASYSPYDPFHYVFLLEAQAEISFKAGEQNAISNFERHLPDYAKEIGRKAGVREVVEWIKEENDKNPQVLEGSFIIAKLSQDRWQAKLKEWGISLV